MSTRKQYQGALKILCLYWKTYGGGRALLRSPFLHAAAVLTGLCVPLWWSAAWWERSISIIPSILGFSIAAFTLLLGIGDENFRRKLATRRPLGTSTLSNTSAGIFHFIIIQVAALGYALFASGKPLTFALAALDTSVPSGVAGLTLLALSKLFRAVGFFLLCYALFTAVAATMSIFRLSDLFSTFVSKPATPSNTEQPAKDGDPSGPDNNTDQAQ